ncbi:MAG: phenylacetate-CoA oxygenase subunit PaaI [Haliscomenobacteraceae bacterium CHB4]|nr:1,2-phenylacetyl-CoA epoxidase, subunit C [Saprospiraceae bacterium]MCE7925907.1 phenylacetate-CoA oxygenase subunit PaaI [Haliscomenobacteraceae bacterium CHB4]
MDTNQALFQYCLRLGDTNLILGHRLAEMCSRAPFLEEDVALTNFALDHTGQAEALLQYAGQLEGKGRTEDDLAYLRPEWEYRNMLLVEQPNTDFAYVIVRQWMLDTYQCLLYDQLRQSKDAVLAGMATRFLKEAIYHYRHSSSWVERLGQGTDESQRRIRQALDDLWKFTPEMFAADTSEIALAALGIVPESADLLPQWTVNMARVCDKAGLQMPSGDHASAGIKSGRHTEHLGHLLAEMQYLQRAYPGAKW